MRLKVAVICVGLFLISLSLPEAASAQCDFSGFVAPDGRLSDPFFINSAGNDLHFFTNEVSGRSYSVEVVAVGNNNSGLGLVVGGDVFCPVADKAGTIVTTNSDPSLNGGGIRKSFTSTVTQNYGIAVTLSASTRNVIVSVTDTTISSPAWSTNVPFETFYSLQNTTNASITATITLLSLAGAVVDTASMPIPAGGTFSTNTQAMATPDGQTGVARITHNGPPGSVLCQAAIASFSISPPFLQPLECSATREGRH